MNIQLRDGLLSTSIELSYRGNSRVIDNVVIDTGASESIISSDIVEDFGIVAELEDNVNAFFGVGGSLQNFFSKQVDTIKIDNIELKGMKMHFGVIDPMGCINGLLGLDVLMKLNAVLDLKKLVLTVSS